MCLVGLRTVKINKFYLFIYFFVISTTYKRRMRQRGKKICYILPGGHAIFFLAFREKEGSGREEEEEEEENSIFIALALVRTQRGGSIDRCVNFAGTVR